MTLISTLRVSRHLICGSFVNFGIGTSRLELELKLEMILQKPLSPPQNHHHVTNEKYHISIFTRPMAPKLSRVVTQDKAHQQSHVTPWSRVHVTSKKRCISTFTRPITPNIAGEENPLLNSRAASITWSHGK